MTGGGDSGPAKVTLLYQVSVVVSRVNSQRLDDEDYFDGVAFLLDYLMAAFVTKPNLVLNVISAMML